MGKCNRPLGVDLCCGVGGMSLGFEQAGFEVVAAVDIEQIHVDAHKQNFPTCKTWRADLAEISGSDIRREAEIGDRAIDVVFSGPPCQGFSLIGKRRAGDERNLVLLEVARLIVGLSPRYFAVENVEGVLMGDARRILEKFVARVRHGGYEVVDPIQTLDAADFGVPQHRRRVFILGYKKDLPAPSYPDRLASPGENGERDGPTVWDAISDLPRIDAYSRLLSTDEYRGALGEASPYAMILRGERRDRADFSHIRNRSGNGLTGCMRTIHTCETVNRFRHTKQGDYEEVSRFHRLSKNGLANTLRAGTGPAQGSFMAPRPIHPFQDRCITVREAARLHSFPDWFVFHATKWHAFRQIGNSVPPRLARAAALTIRRVLLARARGEGFA